MKIKKTAPGIVADAIIYSVVTVMTLAALYPIWHVFMASISNPFTLFSHRGLLLWPQGEATLMGYQMTFKNPNIWSGYRNTLFYVVAGTSFNLFFTTLCAYVMSKKYMKIRKLMSTMVIITMFFGGGMIPTFFVIKSLGFYNTVWAILLPSAISSYNVIVMRTFFANIPVELEEAAFIDGAGDATILFRVYLPLSKAIFAVMLLFYGVGRWNSWFDSMLYLRNSKLHPLQYVLRSILASADSNAVITTSEEMANESVYNEIIRYCTIMVATLPVLFVYPFLQKYFVKGVMVGSLKG